MRFADSIVHGWYSPRTTPLAALLWPLSLVYGIVVAVRRRLYRSGWITSERLAAPVVVIGNITVGGSGKTPLVRTLAHALSKRGWLPGVVSRGYGASVDGARVVQPDDRPGDVGDEPLMLARDGIAVAIAIDRVHAARALLAAHPEVNVILSDDGLQHYALQRDAEIVAVDLDRGLGNGWMLPAGPLREPAARLHEVDAIVFRGVGQALEVTGNALQVRASEALLDPVNLIDPDRGSDLARVPHGALHAIAGIASPERFFSALRARGLDPVCHAFPDHHRFVAADLDFAGASAIAMTEKDAVKCAAFGDERMWMFPLRVTVGDALVDLIEERIRGRQAA